ncbi:MAG: hypothetical protein WC101_02495 [Candidatus Gracilibacteria bacterium]
MKPSSAPFNYRDSKESRDAIRNQYLYYGPSKAMDSIYSDLRTIIKNQGSHPSPEDIEYIDFLSEVVVHLSRLSFTSRDIERTLSFKRECFDLLNKDPSFYEEVGATTPYSKTVRRFYNTLYILNPVESYSESPITFPDGRMTYILEGVLNFADRIEQALENMASRREERKQKKHQ